MSSKHKRGAEGPATSGRSPREEVDRLIAKGWYKDAIKQAKLLHRGQPTPEHHRLLERAYLLRAQELKNGGMPKAAQEVAGQLLDFGITDPELTEPAATLLVSVGLGRQAVELQGRLATPEAIDRLARQAADQAVLHPEHGSPTPEILDGAKRIRAALEATTAGGSEALDALRDVSRTSPFADWRLFARGLAAFRRGEDDDARANWDRLDPNRAAARIARALSGATESAPLDARPSTKLEGLERRTFGEPILGSLQELGELVARGLWTEVVRKLGPVRLALKRVDPSLAVRLTRALYALVIREATKLDLRGAQNLLRGFTKAAEPLPIDPRWNRLWAIAWEGPQGHPDEAEPFWRKYLDDLETSTALQPEERPLARALVLTHMGNEWAEIALELDPDDKGPRGRVSEEAMEATEARRKAVSLLEESLKLFPSHRATYQALMDVHQAGGQSDRAASVAGRLIKVLPDDFETLDFLTEHHFGLDEPARALEFALRARKLKPLDQKILRDEWACRVALARHHALGARWDEARAELDTASRLEPEFSRSPLFSARRICLEIKAGQPAAARAIIDEALERLPEPAPLWLAVAIEARRYQLPQSEIDRYEAQWQAAASGKVLGETAGALATLMGGFLDNKITYAGRETHTKQVMDYFQRTTRIKYKHDDLARVCSLAGLVPNHGDLFEKLTRRGLKLFPEAPEFPMMLGAAEMAKGPFHANLPQAQKYFENALKLAEAQSATNPKAAELIPKIKDAVTALNDLLNSPMGFPFRSGPKSGPMASMLDEFEAMMANMQANPDDDDFFDPDDDDEFVDAGYWGPPPSPEPGPAPGKPRETKKKKKKKR